MAGIVNTGSGSVIWGGGEPVAKVAFDEIVDRVTNHGERRVRLLKLDCEGAEWPILLTSQRLDLIDEICGEFHEIGGQFLEISENRPAEEPVFSLAARRNSPSMCWSATSSTRGSPSASQAHAADRRARGAGIVFRNARAGSGLNDPPDLDANGSGTR